MKAVVGFYAAHTRDIPHKQREMFGDARGRNKAGSMSLHRALVFSFHSSGPPRCLGAAGHSNTHWFLSTQFTHAWRKEKKNSASTLLPRGKSFPLPLESDSETELRLPLVPSARRLSPTRLVALHGFSAVLLQLSGAESKVTQQWK